RKHPRLLLWILWLWCTSAPLLAIDLGRSTKHLSFIRYVLIAGPPVYALASAMTARLPGAFTRNAVPAIVWLACVLSLSSAYEEPRGGFPAMAQFLDQRRRDAEPVIFAAGGRGWVPIATFLAMSDESRAFPWPMIVSDEAPMNELLLARVRAAGGAIVITDS